MLNDLLAVAESADRSRQIRSGGKSETKSDSSTTDAVNPIKLGRKSRAVLDDLWEQFASITSPTRSSPAIPLKKEYRAGEDLTDFETPQAAFTTVLVIGATGKVGRVLVRKLLLRGYTVRALVRANAEGVEERPPGIPQSVQLVFGDIGDYAACREAAQGADKVIYAAKSRSSYNVDLDRVEEQGVYNAAKAIMDLKNETAQKKRSRAPQAKHEIANFGNARTNKRFEVTKLGPDSMASSALDQGQNQVELFKRIPTNGLVFRGSIYTRNSVAEMTAELDIEDTELLADSEGIVVRLRGDGQLYQMLLTTGTGATYQYRLPSKKGYARIRMPFNAFRPTQSGEPPLHTCIHNLTHIAIKFEPGSRSAPLTPQQIMFGDDMSSKRFDIELSYIRALPAGTETDFILVGCAGVKGTAVGMDNGTEDAAQQLEKLVAAKRRGEQLLKNTGLGYTVIRSGPLIEEPGGYKALIFDQGNRITQGISCADVADVCVKSLHDPAARNKAFEVCYEYTPESGLEMYELVAHLPDKSNNYLGPALSTLQKNT